MVTDTQAPAPDDAAPFTSLEEWGHIAPQERQIAWDGRLVPVVYRLTSGAEEGAILVWVAETIDPAEQHRAEGVARLAHVLVSVNGRPLAQDWPTFEDRYKGIDRWDDALLDMLQAEYTAVAALPTLLYRQMRADPNTWAAAADSGISSAAAASGRDDALPPASGPSPRSTPRKTSARTRSAPTSSTKPRGTTPSSRTARPT